MCCLGCDGLSFHVPVHCKDRDIGVSSYSKDPQGLVGAVESVWSSLEDLVAGPMEQLEGTVRRLWDSVYVKKSIHRETV